VTAEDGNPATSPAPRQAELGWSDLVIALAVVWAFDVLVVVGRDMVAGPEGAGPAALYLGASLQWAWAFGVCWFIARRSHGRPFGEGLAIRRVRGAAVGASAALGVVAALAVLALRARFPHEGAPGPSPTPAAWALGVFALLAFPFAEEIYYRGFVFGILARKTGPPAAIGIVTLWFVVAHLEQMLGDWVAFGGAFVMGAVLTLQRHVSGSLVPSLVCHWSYNATLVAAALAGHAWRP